MYLKQNKNQKIFNEDQLFTILRIIQNYENRRDIFKEGKKFNQPTQHNTETSDIIEVDQLQQLIEVEHGFDIKTWNELLNDITHKIADTFVSSSIEV